MFSIFTGGSFNSRTLTTQPPASTAAVRAVDHIVTTSLRLALAAEKSKGVWKVVSLRPGTAGESITISGTGQFGDF